MLWPLEARAQSGMPLESVTVTGDQAHLIELQPSETAFGIAKPLLETPRAITVVSDTTLDRYGVTGVDTLSAITPSAYTASYYGVEGAVNLRGTLAESYFRGFKRVEDRGTYQTPLGDAAGIEILRGPPSPVYGAGKVGGLINFIPKSESGDSTDLTGEATATYGSYSRRNLTGQAGMPLDLGFAHGGVHAYGEVDDSFSYYRGLHPSHQLAGIERRFRGRALGAVRRLYVLPFQRRCADAGLEPADPGADRQRHLYHRPQHVAADQPRRHQPDPQQFRRQSLYFQSQLHSRSISPRLIAAAAPMPPIPWTAASAPAGFARRTVYVAPGVDFSNTITHTGFWNWRGRWTMATICASRLLAIRCRMTALSPTAFPAPIAPRSARRGRAMISAATRLTAG